MPGKKGLMQAKKRTSETSLMVKSNTVSGSKKATHRIMKVIDGF